MTKEKTVEAKKRERTCKASYDSENDRLTISLEGEGEIDVVIDRLPTEVQHAAMVSGIRKHIMEAGNSEKGAARFEAMLAARDRLVEGKWGERTSGGSGNKSETLNAYCLYVADQAEARGKPCPERSAIEALFASFSRSQKRQLAMSPELAPYLRKEVTAGVSDMLETLF